jgi:hypothetical protein
MDSEDLRDKLIEITIGEKQYALVPLCTFNDIQAITEDKNRVYVFQSQIIEERFGLKDMVNTVQLYEVTDHKKVMLAKIKYGI